MLLKYILTGDISEGSANSKMLLLLLVTILNFTDVVKTSVSFEYSTSNDLVMVKYSSILYPICSSGWNTQWNGFVCRDFEFGSAVSYASVPASVSRYSANGYFLPLSGTPVNSLEDVLSGPRSSCSSNRIVAVNCSYDECGTNRKTLATRSKIIGGTNSIDGGWPWQVAILYNYGGASVTLCGGSLIHREWVVTAAHCVDQDLYNPHKYFMVFGDTYRSNSSVSKFRQTSVGRRIYSHELYDLNDLGNDIALIQLATPVKFTFYVHPVCLPYPGEIFPKTALCYATGWGRTGQSPSSRATNYLKEAQLTLVKDYVCERTFGKDSVFERYQMLCAGSLNGVPGTCRGDSGGALSCMDSFGRFRLVGITSWGLSGSTKICITYGVYAEVAKYITWIRQRSSESNLPISSGSGFDYDYIEVPRSSAQLNTASFGTFIFISGVLSYMYILL